MDTSTIESTGASERDDDLRRVIAMILRRLDETMEEYTRIEQWIDDTEAHIRDARERQQALTETFRQIEASALLFGFDLNAEWAARNEDRPAEARPFGESTTKPKTVREVLLELGRMSGGQPLRASALRKALGEQYGMDVHEKTVGMTLYRLSKTGAFTRRGIDWFFVPEVERGAPPLTSDEVISDDV